MQLVPVQLVQAKHISHCISHSISYFAKTLTRNCNPTAGIGKPPGSTIPALAAEPPFTARELQLMERIKNLEALVEKQAVTQ